MLEITGLSMASCPKPINNQDLIATFEKPGWPNFFSFKNL
jgi:hypothetical protein